MRGHAYSVLLGEDATMTMLVASDHALVILDLRFRERSWLIILREHSTDLL